MPYAAPKPCTHPGCNALVRGGSRCKDHPYTMIRRTAAMDYGFIEPDFPGNRVATIRNNIIKLCIKNTPDQIRKNEVKTLEYIIYEAISFVFRKIERERKKEGEYARLMSIRVMDNTVRSAIIRQCDALEKAMKSPPSIRKIKTEIKNKRNSARASLAHDLKKSRRILSNYNWQISNAEKEAKREIAKKNREIRSKMAVDLTTARKKLNKFNNEYLIRSKIVLKASSKYINGNKYPEISLLKIRPTIEGCNIPATSGIYFLWNGDDIEYVGQSVLLSNRLRLGSHHVLNERHKISFVYIEKKNLDFAECHYIGVTCPAFNFGRSAASYKYK